MLAAFVFCWFFSSEILNIFRRPIQSFLTNTKGGLIFTAPMDQILAHIQVSFFTAVFISSPYWMIQLWRFTAPGLYKQEKKQFLIFWSAGIMLFLLGISFSYFVVFPFVFQVLLNFGSGVDQAMITIKNYLSFLMYSLLIFGFIFEMPLIFLFLNKMGILSANVLKKYRRHAVFLLAVLSALLSPPDILSMFLLFIPLIILYELSIILIKLLRLP